MRENEKMILIRKKGNDKGSNLQILNKLKFLILIGDYYKGYYF